MLSLLEQQGYPLYAGISLPHPDFSTLHDAFLETTHALNQQNAAQEGSQYFIFQDTPAPLLIQWEKEEELLFRIESGAVAEVEQLTHQLFLFYRKIPGCTLSDAKQHCARISLHCREILNFYLKQKETSAQYSQNTQSIINTLFSLDDLEKYQLQFFLNVTNMVSDKSVYRNSELIDQIQIYMERNYQKNLTQELIASLFYLNRSYLSQLFRKKTGEKFVDYLNHIRIEKAKELLLSTDKKMYAIAKAVGYENTKYFFRIFKRKTGMSPEAYRKSAAEKMRQP